MSWFKRVESFLEKVDDSVNARLKEEEEDEEASGEYYDDDDDDDDFYGDDYGSEGSDAENDVNRVSEEERKDALNFVSKELTQQTAAAATTTTTKTTVGEKKDEDDEEENEDKKKETIIETQKVSTEDPSNPTTTTTSNEKPQSNKEDTEHRELVHQLRKVMRENKIFKAEIIKQAREIDKLRKDDVRLRTLELEATTNKELIDSLRCSLDAALKDKAAAESDLVKEAEEHRATREHAQQREEQLESYVETYVASISTANAQLQEKERELAETKESLASAQSAYERLQAEADTLSELNKNLSRKLSATEQQQHSDKPESNDEEKCADSTGEVHNENEIEALKKRLENSLKAAEDLQKRLQESTAKCESLEQDLERFTKAAKDKDELIVQLTHDSDQAAQALSEAKKEALRLGNEAKALAERAAKAEENADKLRRQLAAKSVLSAEHMQLESRVRVLTESLAAAQAQLDNVVHDNQRLQILAGATPDEVAESARRFALPPSEALHLGRPADDTNPKNRVGTLTRFVYRHFDTFEGSFAAKHLLPFATKYDSAEMKAQHVLGSSFPLRLMLYLYLLVIQVWWFVAVLEDLSDH